jgi:hypothetical protein
MNEKFVYFAQRNPKLQGRFRPRWRRHAALAMTLPPVWDDILKRYAQYDPATNPPAELGVTGRYDGIGMVWLRGAEAYEGGQVTDAMTRMQQDEEETFSTLVHNTAFVCSETVLKPGEGLYKVFSSLKRGDATTAEAFDAALDAFAAALVGDPALGPKLARLSVCKRNRLSETGGRAQDGLIEASFHTLTDAAAFFGSDAYATVARKHGGQVNEIERCATREVMLDDFDIYD